MQQLSRSEPSNRTATLGSVTDVRSIKVYRNPTLHGAVEMLSANFPATRNFLGSARFEALALDYARANPPVLPIPPLYGQGMADWLGTRPCAVELPCLRDVARCDELATESSNAAEAPVLRPGQLEILPTSDLLNFRLRLHPSTRFEWMGSQAMRLWHTSRERDRGAATGMDEPAGVLFTRRRQRVHGYLIDRAAHRLLAGIRLGEMLGAAAQAASRLYPDVAIARCFEQLVARAAFVAPVALR